MVTCPRPSLLPPPFLTPGHQALSWGTRIVLAAQVEGRAGVSFREENFLPLGPQGSLSVRESSTGPIPIYHPLVTRLFPDMRGLMSPHDLPDCRLSGPCTLELLGCGWHLPSLPPSRLPPPPAGLLSTAGSACRDRAPHHASSTPDSYHPISLAWDWHHQPWGSGHTAGSHPCH